MNAPYLDTGFMLKRYVREPNSDAARVALLAYTPPLPLSEILEMEFVNALHAKVHRKEITAEERDRCLHSFVSDIEDGFWQRCVVDPVRVRERVKALSGRLTPVFGTRTLDLLHLAVALELGSKDFLSFDGRQRQAAQEEGLTVLP